MPRYNAEQRRRHEVRPGLSGLAQVNGRNAISYAMRLYNAEIAVCSFSRIYNRKIVREPFFIDGKSVFYPCVPDQAIKYFIENAIAVWGKMYRSDILKDIRFPEGRLAEEYVFQLKALLSTQVVAFCNKYLYDYRIREDSDAHSIKPKYLLDNIQAIDEAYHVCSEHFVFEQDYCKKHLASLVYEFKSASRFDGLCAIVEDQLHMDPRRSALYLFCGKRCDRIKALLWEFDGFVLLLE